jgi:DinB family protein
MPHHLGNTTSLLARTPAVLDTLLRDLPDTWTLRNEGDHTWSAFDIVGHLIHGERTDWMPRVRTVLQFGESRPFESFDRLGHMRDSEGKSLGQLLDEFSRLRSESLSELRGLNLQNEDLERRGRHPVFGTVTLSQLLATWADHDLTHLHQISRVMAHQYRDAVGPWIRYLGVLQCSGHSSQ